MSETKRPAPKDIAILSGPTEDGQGARVLRIREGDVTAGEIRPVREGEPINHAEVVRLHPLDSGQRVCAVEVLHAPEQSDQRADADQERERTTAGAKARGESKRQEASSSGPARVSNAKYRKNWSTIFEAADKRSKRDWSVN
jgi:hypothetical protein